jgi:hypothetical protein
MKRFRALVARWLLGDEAANYSTQIDELKSHIDALSFFAADTCDVVNPLIVRVAALEMEHAAAKSPTRRLRVKRE